jgi:NMD protein affecting ribosome stability and mRNA decay
MQVNPGDILICQDEKYIVVEESNGMIYTLDFATQKITVMFILRDDQYTIIPKPDNVEFLFIKRRELNSRFIMKYRGL